VTLAGILPNSGTLAEGSAPTPQRSFGAASGAAPKRCGSERFRQGQPRFTLREPACSRLEKEGAPGREGASLPWEMRG